MPTSRRRFLRLSSTAAAVAAADLRLASPVWAQGKAVVSQPARVYVDTRRTISPIDPNLFGSFLEHLERAIYEGDLRSGLELAMRKWLPQRCGGGNSQTVGCLIIRYPGGNFVSGYNWLYGVGPRDKRSGDSRSSAWNSLKRINSARTSL